MTTVIAIIFWRILLMLILAVVARVVLRGDRWHPAAGCGGGILLSELIAGGRSHGSEVVMGRRGVRTPARVGKTAARRGDAARHHHRRACTDADAPPTSRVIAAPPPPPSWTEGCHECGMDTGRPSLSRDQVAVTTSSSSPYSSRWR